MKLNFLFKSSIKATDPVCLMKVAKDENALNYEYQGETYYFCSDSCYQEFKKNPARYAK